MRSYNKLRVTNKNNDFKTVIENINQLIKVKKTNSNMCIGVGFVVTKDNYQEVLEFSDIFKNLDVDYCQFKPEIIQIEREGSMDRSKEQISSNFWLHEVVDVLEKARSTLGNKFECNAYKLEDLFLTQKLTVEIIKNVLVRNYNLALALMEMFMFVQIIGDIKITHMGTFLKKL